MKAIAIVAATLLGASAAFGAETATFEFVHGEGPDAPKYLATTSDPAVISDARRELGKPLALRSLHIAGQIERTSGKDNVPWHWRFVSGKWKLAAISMEVCDGQPLYVDQHLDNWIASVKSYCPWASRVSREIK